MSLSPVCPGDYTWPEPEPKADRAWCCCTTRARGLGLANLLRRLLQPHRSQAEPWSARAKDRHIGLQTTSVPGWWHELHSQLAPITPHLRLQHRMATSNLPLRSGPGPRINPKLCSIVFWKCGRWPGPDLTWGPLLQFESGQRHANACRYPQECLISQRGYTLRTQHTGKPHSHHGLVRKRTS